MEIKVGLDFDISMLALSISNGWLRCINAIKDKNNFNIIDIQSQKIPKNIKDFPYYSDEFKNAFSSSFDKLFSSFEYAKNENLSICVDSGWVESKILSIDKEMNNGVKNKYLMWYMDKRLGYLKEQSKVFFKDLKLIDEKKSLILISIISNSILELIKSTSLKNFLRPVFLEPSVLSIERIISSNTTIVFVNSESTRIFLYENGIITGEGKCTINSNSIFLNFFSGNKKKVKSLINKINQNNLDEIELDIFYLYESSVKSKKYFSSRKKIILPLNPLSGLKLDLKIIKKNKEEDLALYSELFGLISKKINE